MRCYPDLISRLRESMDASAEQSKTCDDAAMRGDYRILSGMAWMLPGSGRTRCGAGRATGRIGEDREDFLSMRKKKPGDFGLRKGAESMQRIVNKRLGEMEHYRILIAWPRGWSDASSFMLRICGDPPRH